MQAGDLLLFSLFISRNNICNTDYNVKCLGTLLYLTIIRRTENNFCDVMFASLDGKTFSQNIDYSQNKDEKARQPLSRRQDSR